METRLKVNVYQVYIYRRLQYLPYNTTFWWVFFCSLYKTLEYHFVKMKRTLYLTSIVCFFFLFWSPVRLHSRIPSPCIHICVRCVWIWCTCGYTYCVRVWTETMTLPGVNRPILYGNKSHIHIYVRKNKKVLYCNAVCIKISDSKVPHHTYSLEIMIHCIRPLAYIYMINIYLFSYNLIYPFAMNLI